VVEAADQALAVPAQTPPVDAAVQRPRVAKR
jgi:hypothetical protein